MFTATPLSGNGLAVVHDADALDDATMLAFARETRLSETTFVQRPQVAGADYRNRIWTMAGEIAFAGHPSMGTAVAVALERGQLEASFVQETLSGLQPVDVRFTSPGVARASVLQEPATFGAHLEPADYAAVGLEPGDAGDAFPAQVVSTGLGHALLPVSGPAALDRCLPDLAALEALLARVGAVTAYVAHADVATGTARTRAFFLVPSGVLEDPGTGSAAGPLCAAIARATGIDRITVRQGVEMGRPSRIEAEMEGDRVRVSGDVVVVLRGVLDL